MSRIVTVTANPAVDKSTRVDRVEPDRKLRCERARFDPGGGGLNVSRALERLGSSSCAVTVVGGPTGDLLSGLLDDAGISVRALPTRAWTRENLTVVETGADDRQYRFGMPGPELSEDEWQGMLDALAEELSSGPEDEEPDGEAAGDRFVVASGSLPPSVPVDFYARVGEVASEAGASLIVDTSGDALRCALDAGVFLLKPNLRELMDVTGRSLDEVSEDEASRGIHEQAARELVERGSAEVVLVSMGSAGALCVTGDECQHIPSPTVPIRSRVGAGDSTVAGVVHALRRGWSLMDAARYGVAAGAATVTSPGTELCDRETTDELYGRMQGA